MTYILLETTTILTHLVLNEGQQIPEANTESSLHMKYTARDIHVYTTYIRSICISRFTQMYLVTVALDAGAVEGWIFILRDSWGWIVGLLD